MAAAADGGTPATALSLPKAATVIAADGNTLYLLSERRLMSWTPPSGTPMDIGDVDGVAYFGFNSRELYWIRNDGFGQSLVRRPK